MSVRSFGKFIAIPLLLAALAGTVVADCLEGHFEPVKTKRVVGGDPPQAIGVDIAGVKDLFLHVYTEYLNSRWTPGGGLCVLDLKTGVTTDLVPEFNAGVVNRFDISYDGRRIAFDYKKAADEGYRIYEVGVDGQGLRQLTLPAADEGHPNYRPNVTFEEALLRTVPESVRRAEAAGQSPNRRSDSTASRSWTWTSPEPAAPIGR